MLFYISVDRGLHEIQTSYKICAIFRTDSAQRVNRFAMYNVGKNRTKDEPKKLARFFFFSRYCYRRLYPMICDV